MDDFQIDARCWRFLGNPERYLERNVHGGLNLEPLKRQFKTAQEILKRFASGHGVLLADDAGLGKTTIGALVAWAVACQGKRVRIYAPNEVLRRRWAEELERHVPMLQHRGASCQNIRQGYVGKLNAGRIQVTTSHALVKSYSNDEQHTACDLMIIDEAHRAKGEGSAFNEALKQLGGRAKRKLILTATPFSIRIAELEQLLQFVVGKTDFDFEKIKGYERELKRLHTLGNGYDAAEASNRLVNAACAAVGELKKCLIRHGVDDLSAKERKHFGEVDKKNWKISPASATPEDLALLLRMDRILQLSPGHNGARRNDPRFHIGWQHVGMVLEQAAGRVVEGVAGGNPGRNDARDDGLIIAGRHVDEARKAFRAISARPHPKMAAVSAAIRPVLECGEKVLIFCHHRATASELLGTLESSLAPASVSRQESAEDVWRAAWRLILADGEPLVEPIIAWLSSPGLRSQVSGWLASPAQTPKALARQLGQAKPRNAKSGASIAEAAIALKDALLDLQSTSTRELLRNIAKGTRVFKGKASHFPGQLDEGLRVMGAWDHDSLLDPSRTSPPKTLYTGKPDIVIELFNSPFGPDVLVATDRLSEGVDLHRYCRHLIHYELDPSPIRTLQRNGRVRRVGSWASLTGQSVQYAYPTFGGTRDEKAVDVMCRRIDAFGLLLGGVPALDESLDDDGRQGFADEVMRHAKDKLAKLNRKLAVC